MVPGGARGGARGGAGWSRLSARPAEAGKADRAGPGGRSRGDVGVVLCPLADAPASSGRPEALVRRTLS